MGFGSWFEGAADSDRRRTKAGASDGLHTPQWTNGQWVGPEHGSRAGLLAARPAPSDPFPLLGPSSQMLHKFTKHHH